MHALAGEMRLSARAVLLACAALGLSRTAAAVGPAVVQHGILQTYEPIKAGYTRASDDVPFLDVTLSLKLRLVPFSVSRRSQLYLAFTTRLGFYWGTRHSSPVIGKRFEPELFWRFLPSAATRASAYGPSGTREYAGYIDIGIAHQSDGQAITTKAEYVATLRAVEQPRFARAYVSRGWDYLHVVWKHSFLSRRTLATYVDLKYFLYSSAPYSFEQTQHPMPRRAVDGITLIADYQSSPQPDAVGLHRFGSPNLRLEYQTGYDVPFRNSTFRLTLGLRVAGLPLAFWVQRGYMSDLASYYLDVTSYGVELRFESL